MTLLEVYDQGKALLSENKNASPAFEAGQLLFAVFGVRRGELALRGDTPADDRLAGVFFGHISARLSGYPLQYIVGEWDFRGITLRVGEGVLIPRPETELLVDTGLALIRDTQSPVIYDLCSGSGCIAIAAAKARPDAKVYAVELSPGALVYLRENVARAGVAVTVLGQDALLPIEAPPADIILCNPPYIKSAELPRLQPEVIFEPTMALDGGADGLRFYRELARLHYGALKTGGHIAFELGAGQDEQVRAILGENGYTGIEAVPDLSGIIRVIRANK